MTPERNDSQRSAIRARPQHAGAGEEALDRRLSGLLVDFAIVFELDPGLGGFIEKLQSEVGHILEHGHQPPFHLAPQILNFTIDIGAVRKRRFMQDTEASEALHDLCSGHRRAFIAHRLTGQSPLLKRLRQTMRDDLPALVADIPLKMAGQSRAVVINANQ